MPVLILEAQSSDRPEVLETTFRTVRGILTQCGEELARRNDAEIERRMRKIEHEMEVLGLLGLRGKPGVLRLWWEVGRRLGFVQELDVGEERDRVWVWRALYDHAGRLNPSRSGRLSVRAERRPKNSYFLYMFRLGKLPWYTVERLGDWTSCVELFDSECFDDERFVQWLADRAEKSESPLRRLLTAPNHQHLFRRLAKQIRHRFDRTDTSVFSESELYQELDAVAEVALGGEVVHR